MAHFQDKEFECPCCGLMNITPRHRAMLESTREMAGIPLAVNSGSRCPKHNKEVGGEENSEHLTGEGTDLEVVTSRQRHKVLKAAFSMGFTRIGIAKTFIHLGSSSKLPKEVTWLY